MYKIILLVVFIFFYSTVIFPCEHITPYFPPSNYRLVKIADAIVLAETINYKVNPEPAYINSSFEFKINEVLKGKINVNKLEIKGFNNFQGRSPIGDFSKARPGAYTGVLIQLELE